MSNQSVPRNTLTRRWIAIAGVLAVTTAIFVQWRMISQLRHENESLRAQVQPLPVAAPEPIPIASAGDAVETEQSRKDRLELLRLRGEVGQLREQVARSATTAGPVASQLAAPEVPAGQYRDDEIRQLGVAAMQANSGALDKLAKLAAAAGTMNTNDQAAVRSDIQRAFEALGTEAGKGNAAALQAVWQASRIPDLQGFAVQALGQAAGQGNQEALKPLLAPESYLILPSSAVAALKHAADAGNEQAIQALAATAGNRSQSALWFLAAQGLESAAGAGNATAIDSLAALAAGDNQNVRKEALLALEAAARKSQPRAEEALRKLGWR
jgi:hypothetical protein